MFCRWRPKWPSLAFIALLCVAGGMTSCNSFVTSLQPAPAPYPPSAAAPAPAAASTQALRDSWRITLDSITPRTGCVPPVQPLGLVATSDGGYALAAYTDWPLSSGPYDVVNHDLSLVKVNAEGKEVWRRTFGSSDRNEFPVALGRTGNGGYSLLGYSYGEESKVTLLAVHTDSEGNRTWDKTLSLPGVVFPENIGVSGGPTQDGGYIITGAGFKEGDLGWSPALIKIDNQADLEWTARLPGYSFPLSIQQTTDDGYILTGYTTASASDVNIDLWLLKTDEKGIVEWSKTFGGSGSDVGYCVRQTSDGGFIVVGATENYGYGGSNLWLVKTDAKGNKVWDKGFGGRGDDVGYSVCPTADGGYIVSGAGGGQSALLWLLKIGANGDRQWEKSVPDGFAGYALSQTPDAGYIIAGFKLDEPKSKEDLCLMKIDVNGN
jgi:hypothetical protein